MTGRPIGEPTWSPAGEGEQLWFVGTLATIRVPGEAVGGRYALIEFLFPRGASPPRHTHPQDESYIVVDGQLTVQAGERRFERRVRQLKSWPGSSRHTDKSTSVHRWAPTTDRADSSGIGKRSRAASDDSCLSRKDGMN